MAARERDEQKPETFWRDQFLYALSGLSWAVGKLGDEAGYAGVVHARLTNPIVSVPGRTIALQPFAEPMQSASSKRTTEQP
jgi:hypothetical protein